MLLAPSNQTDFMRITVPTLPSSEQDAMYSPLSSTLIWFTVVVCWNDKENHFLYAWSNYSSEYRVCKQFNRKKLKVPHCHRGREYSCTMIKMSACERESSSLSFGMLKPSKCSLNWYRYPPTAELILNNICQFVKYMYLTHNYCHVYDLLPFLPQRYRHASKTKIKNKSVKIFNII